MMFAPMTAYGPRQQKQKEETFAQYNERINIRLIKFIRDASFQPIKTSTRLFSSLHYAPEKENGFVLTPMGIAVYFSSFTRVRLS